LGIVAVHRSVSQKHGDRLSIATYTDGIVDLDRTLVGTAGGIDAVNERRSFDYRSNITSERAGRAREKKEYNS
jgi:hypothetical protein